MFAPYIFGKAPASHSSRNCDTASESESGCGLPSPPAPPRTIRGTNDGEVEGERRVTDGDLLAGERREGETDPLPGAVLRLPAPSLVVGFPFLVFAAFAFCFSVHSSNDFSTCLWTNSSLPCRPPFNVTNVQALSWGVVAKEGAKRGAEGAELVPAYDKVCAAAFSHQTRH